MITRVMLTSRRLSGPLIEIRVGSGDHIQSFCVPEGLITSRSPFFANALDGTKWREGEERLIHLPDDYPNVFSSYLQLLYQGNLPIRKSINPSTKDKVAISKEVSKLMGEEMTLLADLYVFVEKIQDISSKCLVLTAFVESSTHKRADGLYYSPNSRTVKTLFDGTTNTDPIRKWLVDLHVLYSKESWIEGSTIDDFSVDFLFQVTKEFTSSRNQAVKGTRPVKDPAPYIAKMRGLEKKGKE